MSVNLQIPCRDASGGELLQGSPWTESIRVGQARGHEA